MSIELAMVDATQHCQRNSPLFLHPFDRASHLAVHLCCDSYRRSRMDGINMLSVKHDEEKQVLIITIDTQKPTPSASGKTLVLASTHGNQATTVQVNGRPVIVGVNAYIRAGR